MSQQRLYLIIGLLAIVTTIYLLRDSHIHYLLDLLALALALAAPRVELGIGAFALLALVRHTRLANGLAPTMPSWLVAIILPAASNMSIPVIESSALESAYKQRILHSDMADENSEIHEPVAEIAPENIVLVQSEILARLVISGEVGLTKAIQIGAGAKSGAKYQRYTRLVKAEIERQQNHYPPTSNLKRFE